MAAVPDYFALSDVTLIGLSLGGGLAIRAAAFEPRVKRVIAYDVLFDFLSCNLSQLPVFLQHGLRLLLHAHFDGAVSLLARRMSRSSPITAWGLQQGMHVTGTDTPAQYLRAIARYNTASVSSRVSQDVLLLAGREDHLLPIHQFTEQISALTGARSVTARLFTRAESAQNHVQVGNLGLAFRVMQSWLEQNVSELN